jgi:hypothetical protein
MAIDRTGSQRNQSPQNTNALLWSDDPVSLGKVLACIEMLPKEYFTLRASVSPRSPEAAMMFAVLEDALHCFRKQFVSRSRRAKRLAQEAEDWLFNDDCHWLFSFVSICDVLGLDPNYIRCRLKRRNECDDRGEPPDFARVA